MRFNKQELMTLATQPSQKFEKEGTLYVRERQEGFFRRTESEFLAQLSCRKVDRRSDRMVFCLVLILLPPPPTTFANLSVTLVSIPSSELITQETHLYYRQECLFSSIYISVDR